ncbi:MAG: hypothetical protein KGQ57_19100 [Burkholderiales bacterium]|nr:hypothetical protein [Burkholderiales bacterium]
MPLYPDIEDDICMHLRRVADGERVKPIAIGRLTDDQHRTIAKLRLSVGLPGLDEPEILLLGRHMHRSRIVQDLYTIEDVLSQIRSALAETSIVHGAAKMTTVQSTVLRDDGYGAMVRDEAVLELYARKPRAELFSVIPKGDVSPAKRAKSQAQKKERPLESGLKID